MLQTIFWKLIFCNNTLFLLWLTEQVLEAWKVIMFSWHFIWNRCCCSCKLLAVCTICCWIFALCFSLLSWIPHSNSCWRLRCSSWNASLSACNSFWVTVMVVKNSCWVDISWSGLRLLGLWIRLAPSGSFWDDWQTWHAIVASWCWREAYLLHHLCLQSSPGLRWSCWTSQIGARFARAPPQCGNGLSVGISPYQECRWQQGKQLFLRRWHIQPRVIPRYHMLGDHWIDPNNTSDEANDRLQSPDSNWCLVDLHLACSRLGRSSP